MESQFVPSTRKRGSHQSVGIFKGHAGKLPPSNCVAQLSIPTLRATLAALKGSLSRSQRLTKQLKSAWSLCSTMNNDGNIKQVFVVIVAI